MVDEEDAERAVEALKMVLAGLPEEALELISDTWPSDLADRGARLQRLAALGRDLAIGADAAAMALERATRADIPR